MKHLYYIAICDTRCECAKLLLFAHNSCYMTYVLFTLDQMPVAYRFLLENPIIHVKIL